MTRPAATFSIAMNLAPPSPLADATACRVYAALVIPLAAALDGDVPFPWRCRVASFADGLAIRAAMRAALISACGQERRSMMANLAALDRHIAPIAGEVFQIITVFAAAPSVAAH